MRTIGTVVRGVRAPIIREGDNIAEVAAASVMEAWKEAGIEPRDRDGRRRDGIRRGRVRGQLRNARPDRERRARKDRRRHRGRRVPNPEPQPLLSAAARHGDGLQEDRAAALLPL